MTPKGYQAAPRASKTRRRIPATSAARRRRSARLYALGRWSTLTAAEQAEAERQAAELDAYIDALADRYARRSA